MAEDRIDSIIDRPKIKAEVDATARDIQSLISLIQSVKGKGLEINGAKSLAELNGLSKQLDGLRQQTNESTNAVTNNAKATAQLNKETALRNQQAAETNKNLKLQAQLENAVKGSNEEAAIKIKQLEYQQSILNKTTESGRQKYAQLSAEIQKQKTFIAQNSEAYKNLVTRFTAAANEAKNLAAQYGVNDVRAKQAAASALQLNNQLKQIDASVGIFNRDVGGYHKALDGIKDRFKELGSVVLGFIGIQAGLRFFEDSIDQFLELDKTMRLLQNTTKNLGVPELFERIKKSTEELGHQFGFLKEEDIASAFNKLLVYGKLSEEQINQLMPVVIDFATATGQSLPDAAGVLTKALEGNAKGLRQFGIDIKDGKNEAERFDIIMSELGPRVEGVGKTFGDSAAGKIAKAREEFRKIKEEIGQQLTPVLTNLLTFLSHVVQGLDFLAHKLVEVGGNVVDFFNGFDGAINQGIKAAERLRKEVKQGADLIVDEFRDKTPLEIGEEIVQIQVRIGNLNKLLKQAKENKEGTFSAEDVKRFKTGVDVNNEALKQLLSLQFQARNKAFYNDKDAAEDKKKIEDFGKEVLKINEEINKALFDADQELRKQQADSFKQSADDERNSLAERLSYLQEYVLKQQEITTKQYEFDQSAAEAAIEVEKAGVNEKLTAKDLTVKQRADLNKELKALDEKLVAELKLLSVKYDGEILKLAESTQKTAEELIDKLSKHSPDLKDLKKTWDDAATHINDKIRSTSQVLIDENKKKVDDTAETNKKIEELNKERAQKEQELAKEVTGLVFDLATRRFDLEKDLIQKQINDLDVKEAKDIEVAKQTIQNEQDRAAAITAIQATVANQKEILATRQRQLDEQKAKFDKAQSIVSIVQDTATAVVAALTQVKVLGPAAIALAAVIGAIGAVQIARVIAQPIPKYAKGTESHKGGLAVVGDAGKAEGVELPDGSIMRTPAEPTIVDLPKGTKVYPDYEKMLAKASVTKIPTFNIKSDTSEKAIRQAAKDIVRAIKNQPHDIITPEPAYKRMRRLGNDFRTYLDNNK